MFCFQPVWVSSSCSGFLPQSKDTLSRSTGDSKLTLRVDKESVLVCLSVLDGGSIRDGQVVTVLLLLMFSATILQHIFCICTNSCTIRRMRENL